MKPESRFSSGLASTMVELARIQGGVAPPLIRTGLADGTNVTGRWHLRPFESYLSGLEDHVVLATLAAEGSATWRTSTRTLQAPMVAGALTVVPRGHEGYWRITGGGIHRAIFFGPARLQRCANELSGRREPELQDRLQALDPTLFAIMHLIDDELESDRAASVLLLDQLVDLLCLQLLRADSCVAAQVERVPRGGLAPWQVNRAISYMRSHLDQEVSLQDLAEVVRLSRFHFCSAFRHTTGSTPYEALTRLRIDEASRLLVSSSQSISEIALAVGFQTPSAFAARFRKSVGTTPRAYRRSLRPFTPLRTRVSPNPSATGP